MQPVILYCYDAYCNWCYAFSPVITRIAAEFDKVVPFEVLSGGMIITDDAPRPISVIASYLKKNCQTVSQQTGATFGEDFLWHINNPDLSDWFPCSEKPAIALCVFKEYYPDKQVAFAADLAYALQYEGRDLCDDEAYRHLLTKYNINADTFYALLNDPAHKEKAVYEFELCKQLHITGFPTVLIQVNESKFIMLAEGYTSYEVLHERIKKALKDLAIA